MEGKNNRFDCDNNLDNYQNSESEEQIGKKYSKDTVLDMNFLYSRVPNLKERLEYQDFANEQLKYLLKLSLDLEIYDVAFELVNFLIEKNGNFLENDERALLMKAGKERFNYFRNGWKNLVDYQFNEKDEEFIPKEKVENEINKLEIEIQKFCNKMIENADSLSSNVIDTDYATKIFYTKIKADYLRYLTEIANEDDFPKYMNEAKKLYESAYKLSHENLVPEDPLTLSLILNYSVFLYFILDDTKMAYKIADTGYKSAIVNINIVDEEKDYEVNTIIKRIEENLTIWKIELFDIN